MRTLSSNIAGEVRRVTCLLSLILLHAGTAAATTVGPNLIKDWSFEGTEVRDPKGWEIFTNRDLKNSGSPWFSPRNFVEYQENLFGKAKHGNQYLEVDAKNEISLQQQVRNTERGGRYEISFFYAARPDTAFQKLGVYWNHELVHSVSGRGDGGYGLDWRHVRFQVTSDRLTSVLGFGSLFSPPGGYGNFVDSVSVRRLRGANTAVPEPTSMLLLTSALAGAAVRRKKCSKEGAI